jgi:hypothetical protein
MCVPHSSGPELLDEPGVSVEGRGRIVAGLVQVERKLHSCSHQKVLYRTKSCYEDLTLRGSGTVIPERIGGHQSAGGRSEIIDLCFEINCSNSGSTRSMEYTNRFARASRKYRPDILKLLFVAEAPPAYRTGRFFYFTGLREGDTLFLEMMKTLYPDEVGFSANGFLKEFSSKLIRIRKSELLNRFRSDGFYLIDAYEQSMPESASTGVKTALIRGTLPRLRKKMRRLCGKQTVGIVLIGGPTYHVCAGPLRADGMHVLNTEPLNHPARGGQVLFRSKLRRILDASLNDGSGLSVRGARM